MSAGAPPRAGARHAAGEGDIVKLDPDHPGFRDEAYRRRRNAIAKLALDHVLEDAVPRVNYTQDEHAVWRLVWEKLAPVHARYACREFMDSDGRLRLDRSQIPQLADVNAQLVSLTGFQMLPVAGLVSSRAFLGRLSEGIFLSTQYIRHASRPLYTPEPDIIHELVGHAGTLCHPIFASMNRLFGAASAAFSDKALPALERVYWYTMEFGLIRQDGAMKSYGAGLLSSFGELERFEAAADVRRFDPERAAACPYDPTTYQSTLYWVPDFETLERDVRTWLDGVPK